MKFLGIDLGWSSGASGLCCLRWQGEYLWVWTGNENWKPVIFWLRDRIHRKPRCISLSLNFKVAVSTTLALLGVGTLAFFLVESRNLHTLGQLPLSTQIYAAWFQSAIS